MKARKIVQAVATVATVNKTFDIARLLCQHATIRFGRKPDGLLNTLGTIGFSTHMAFRAGVGVYKMLDILYECCNTLKEAEEIKKSIKNIFQSIKDEAKETEEEENG